MSSQIHPYRFVLSNVSQFDEELDLGISLAGSRPAHMHRVGRNFSTTGEEVILRREMRKKFGTTSFLFFIWRSIFEKIDVKVVIVMFNNNCT